MAEIRSKTPLFGEFPPISREDWMAQVEKDLKGADFAKKLVWKTSEGFDMMPYYDQTDLEGLSFVGLSPGQFPYVRGYQSEGNAWFIRQDISVKDIPAANAKALDALCRGAGAIGFVCSDEAGLSFAEFRELLKGLHPEAMETHFVVGNHASGLLSMFAEDVKLKGIHPDEVSGSLDLDPLGYLASTGNFCCRSEQIAFSNARGLIEEAKEMLPKFRVLNVNGSLFHLAGANLSAELGLSLSMAAEYIHRLTDLGLKVADIVPRMSLQLSAGTQFFPELAKFRAARLLWARLITAFDPQLAPEAKVFIHALSSERNYTMYDPYVNMLRATTSAMSAILGGVSSLTVLPFDHPFAEPGEFSERIARNIQLILREESHLDKVADPAGGSYYLEQLTEKLAAEAWKLFVELEEEGGFLAALKSGSIQRRLNQSAEGLKKNLASRKEILLGTNQYPNNAEKISDQIRKTETKKVNGSEEVMIVEPLRPFRLAGEFERLRLAVENAAQPAPRVFLLTYGNLNMRKARAGFATNFFGCAGLQVMDNPGFLRPEEGCKAAEAAGARFVVICSGDEEYAEIVPIILRNLPAGAIPVLAGYPTDLVEGFKALGLKNFIHVRSNVKESLEDFIRQAGIEFADRA